MPCNDVKVERNVSEINTMSPISHYHSTFNSPMTNFGGDRSPDLDYKHETSDGMSTTFNIHKDLSGNSTTFELSKDKSSSNLDDSESSNPKFQSLDESSIPKLQDLKDPLNLSNVHPDQEAKIKKLRVEKFKVNGQRSEMNKDQVERSKKLADSKRGRYKKVVADLDLQEEIPIPKVVLDMPKPGEKHWWEPKEVIDIRDSIMGSTRGYDLKVQWGKDENGKTL